MFKNRLFNVFVVVALVVLAALTIQQALETTRIVSAAGASESAPCAIPVVDRSSIHSEYVEEMGIWLPQSDSGPTGVDGGLLYLLSGYRECSQ